MPWAPRIFCAGFGVSSNLDLGGDKWPGFLRPRFETNPNLGGRELRLSLSTARALFWTQLAALVATADISILFPMVLGLKICETPWTC